MSDAGGAGATSAPVPVSVLDVVPVFAGMTAEHALRGSVELARGVERLGYRRHWVVEHHNTPGVAVTAPPSEARARRRRDR